ncbi:7-carboxy-7-deazaguanine synthase QueE [Microbulbifer sp. ANSA003]|uniref:7-carboxy-7-deazaguanine synthase QueE n=1 Tax=unclassified Microbulbifer TaxID=2619833 RepID=UPI000D52EB2D|nr:7-carboxy-7-deazaguanine synthase QueE [Microbulbifer sp. A4B17]AWF79995.1 7-carboxy-7-deazaguanine synthase QueE [Microbulbifer sp. A4B17]WNZ57140.1 7-carboxy-7-deazaguanine synthase QueE [Microbulbifer sp. MKSA007]
MTDLSKESLRISEIFYSLQGEARESGLPTVFVRLTGCPLRCTYCDSEYAFYGGERMTLEQILQQVQSHPARHVCVTGGEPLAQPNCFPLMKALCDAGYAVSLETSGAMPVDKVDERVSRVVDLKTPASGEQHRNRMENMQVLTRQDQIKFVICDRGDYDWARFTLDQYRIPERVGEVLFSPSYEQLQPRQLAEWILEDGLPVRMQMQMHKLLWGDIPGV